MAKRKKGPGGGRPQPTAGRWPEPMPELAADLDTVVTMANLWGEMPPEPHCDGPVLVHEDGSIECHGPSCPGAGTVFHGDDTVEPCHRRRGSSWAPCGRCIAG